MYTINILEKDGIVKASTTDDVTATDMNETRQTISRICKEQRLTKVLVDDRAVTSIPSFEDLYQFGSTFLDSGFPLFIRIAHVVNGETLSDNEFLETVAVNRGANVKTFQDIDAAIEWLNS